ncbi:hypoxia-inducible factor 1-alpha-like isoform X2 [Genypterus blacodes]|uniref:hypoxia-inducible factor 1-alpha-like isoform X2 n=1 Tax=Genypterus blacodes TaxID=154954 RepID=UPI003F777C8B
MDFPDPAAMIAKRVWQLNKEASLRTLAAQNLQRKRKLSEILGQGPLLNDQQEQKKILKVSESEAPAAVSHRTMLLLPTNWASRLLGSTSESSSLFTLPHLTRGGQRPPAGPAVPPAGRGAAAALDHVH